MEQNIDMSKRFFINNYARGIADDRFGMQAGEFGYSKHFDVLTNPKRLQPLRGMSSHTANTVIGNIILSSSGLMYAVGTDPNNPTLGKLWYLADYGNGTDYASIPTNNQLSGAAVNYELLVDWPDCGNTKTIIWAANNLLIASDPAGGSSATTSALTFSSIGQGLVHPKDKVFYFPYRTSSTPFIGTITTDATPFNTHNYTAFTLPKQYRAYCLSHFQDWLAIPLTTPSGTGVNASIVALWRRDTSVTLFDETIPWGAGSLQVLNNLNGELVGISTASAGYLGTFQDADSILIKTWSGGGAPTLIKEIKVPYIIGTNTVSHPAAVINPRVNFIQNNRLYFSINLVPGDGVNPARYGLWSAGRNKLTGEWTVVQERMVTNTGTETGVIAAAMAGDFVSAAHTAEGTLTKSTNGLQSNLTYGAISVFESGVNPGMDPADFFLNKNLLPYHIDFLPLPTGASVTLKHRENSSGLESDWTTVGSAYSTVGGTHFSTGALTFDQGRFHEFRVESTGGAIIVGMYGDYEIIQQ